MYNTETLDNGLRVIQHPTDNDVVYCGYAIKVGSRNEQEGEEGLAHFCEHASFKGTEHRRAWQLIQAIEGVGGELYAYTNKEATVYYCAIKREHLTKAIDVLTDMVFHSVFPNAELEKEKEVICDEIESYNDTPSELIYDDFENIIFRGHPLGHNILGTKESVRGFTSEDAMRFTRKHYRPENAVFFIEGTVPQAQQAPQSPQGESYSMFRTLEKANKQVPQPHKGESHSLFRTLIKLIEKTFKKYPIKPQLEDFNVQSILQNSPCGGWGGVGPSASYHQAHVLLGRRAYDINHHRRIALYLLNNILGGPAMSSRLNMALREKNGLVYTVESTMASFSDTGLWCIYFGCDKGDVKRCLRLVRKELNKVMEKPLTARQLSQAKHQLKGQIALACDSHESFALDFAKSFLHYGWEKDVTALYRNIDALTAEDLQTVAQELFKEEDIETLIYK